MSLIIQYNKTITNLKGTALLFMVCKAYFNSSDECSSVVMIYSVKQPILYISAVAQEVEQVI